MKFMSEFLTQVKEENLYRQTIDYDPVAPDWVVKGGRSYLMLASNNYLGLTHDEQVKRAAMEAVQRYGAGSGGARLTTGTYPLFRELERELAIFKETEAAMVFNNGYMANLGVITALAGPDDIIFSDELNHASIIDGCRLSRAKVMIYRHLDMTHLKNLLEATACRGKKIIVSDGVFSMDGDMAPLPVMVVLAKENQALVIIDDAHATGVIGPGGKGSAAHFGLQEKITVQIGTLSKALGSEGGFVAGSQELIDYIRNRARSFIFSTAMAPASVAGGLAALRQLMAKPEMVAKLANNAAYLRRALQEARLPVAPGITPIIPVMTGEAGQTLRLMQALDKQGIIVSAIRPPTVPAGGSRLRVTVTAVHKWCDLKDAVEKISAAVRQQNRTVQSEVKS